MYSFGSKFDDGTIRLHLNEFQGEHCEEVSKLLPNIEKYTNIMETNIIKRIAEYVGVGEKNILPVPGSDAGLEMLASGRVKRYSKIFVEAPSYSQFMYYIPKDTEVVNIYSEVWFDRFDIVRAMSFYMEYPGSFLLYLCSPNNPTGKQYSYSSIVQLAEMYPYLDIIVDEAYVEYAPQQKVYDSIVTYENVYITRTFSKAFGLAAIRIGYVISCEQNIEQYMKILNIKNFNPLTESAVNAVLDNKEYYLSIARRTAEERDKIVHRLKGHKIISGHGNFFLLYAGPYKDLLIAKFTKHKIIVRDRSNLPSLDGFIRITASPNPQVSDVIVKLIDIPIPIPKVPLPKDSVTEIKLFTKSVLCFLSQYLVYPTGKTLEGVMSCGGILPGESGVELCVCANTLDELIEVFGINGIKTYRYGNNLIVYKYVKISLGPICETKVEYFYSFPVLVPKFQYKKIYDPYLFPI